MRSQPVPDGPAALCKHARMGPETPPSYAVAVGARLREVRRQQALSLQAVEAMSGLEFRASALGAYERGERVISVPRLQRLAALYRVPIDQLLPPVGGALQPSAAAGSSEGSAEQAGRSASVDLTDRVRIDLTSLEAAPSPDRELLRRFVDLIRLQRQDFNGRVITLRSDDLRALACLLDVHPDDMPARLDELGVRH